MAKWGKGDPRWIVEDRPDAKNVNNWHWTEKNASGWSKETFKRLFEGFVIQDDTYQVTLKELESAKGEASANNRKGKLIFFFEWELKISWEGCLRETQNKIKGNLTIPNLSEENSADEVDVDIDVVTEGEEAFMVKDFVRVFGTGQIRKQLGCYIMELKQKFAEDMLLPTKDGTKSSSTINENTAKSNFNKTVIHHEPEVKPKPVKIRNDRLELTEEFKCTADEMYAALVIPEQVAAWTQGPVELKAEKNGQFKLFGGNIEGTFIELRPGSRIVQRWRQKDWPQGHYSMVTIEMEEAEDSTKLTIKQTQIPEEHLERTREGWKTYYFQSIKVKLGFGALL